MTVDESSKMLMDAIVEGTKEALEPYIGKILATYRRDDGLTLSIPVKLTPGRNGAVQVETGINFIEKRVKDSNIRVVDFRQLPLPGMEERRYALK
ncbi:hypothetical protein [Aminivibrio sp.]|uniref:hypothetical protein n=1 Tax=Aminivibrio sp. TaxID=1872489 RepID=UPI00345E07BD